jgi:hypothetical protein
MSNPAIYDNRQRDGLQSINKLAKQLCLLVNTFGPIIELKYRANPTVLAALEVARAACTIAPALDSVLVTGGDNDTPSDNPENIAGIDPTAPAPPVIPS